jgi:hypothetical protein
MHEGPNTIECHGGDSPAIAEPAYQLAVVHSPAPERRFGQACAAAVIGDFAEDFFGMHEAGRPSNVFPEASALVRALCVSA